MTHDDVRTWLDDYVHAWRSYDPAALASERVLPHALGVLDEGFT